ncbi:MAG TPA: hypothetical protein VEA99_17780 [Gemmatimonadaceae bacterium]|nr:hypothetical protein [Gemmatimonadaceae bacterium]
MKDQLKKQWTRPTIQSYGSFETITQACDKQLGGSDGYTFINAPIVCSAS